MSEADLMSKWMKNFQNKVTNEESLSAYQEGNIKRNIAKTSGIRGKVNNDVYYLLMDKCYQDDFYMVLNMVDHQVKNIIKDDPSVHDNDRNRNRNNPSRVWEVIHNRLRLDIMDENMQSVFKAALKGLQA